MYVHAISPCVLKGKKYAHFSSLTLKNWGLQNNWESSNGFQRFFSSKLVQKSVENRCSIPNYFANRSM